MRLAVIVLVLLALSPTVAQEGKPLPPVYSLYRSSPFEPGGRVHIATFDADYGDSYNAANCELAASLFESQPGVVANYWCEPGPARNVSYQ